MIIHLIRLKFRLCTGVDQNCNITCTLLLSVALQCDWKMDFFGFNFRPKPMQSSSFSIFYQFQKWSRTRASKMKNRPHRKWYRKWYLEPHLSSISTCTDVWLSIRFKNIHCKGNLQQNHNLLIKNFKLH